MRRWCVFSHTVILEACGGVFRTSEVQDSDSNRKMCGSYVDKNSIFDCMHRKSPLFWLGKLPDLSQRGRCTRNTTITVILQKLTRPKPSPESAGYAWLEKQPGKTKFNHLGKGSRSWLTELRLIKPPTSLVFDSPQLKDKEIIQQSEKLQTKSTALLVTSDPGSTVRVKKKILSW